MTLAARRALPAVVVAFLAATIAVGLTIAAEHGWTGYLGTPLPPFLMGWDPSVNGWLVVAVVVAALLVVGMPVAVQRIRRPATFAVVVYLASVALGLAVNAGRRGPLGWSNVFRLGPGGAFEAKFEYLPSLFAVRHGVAHYVQDFPQLLHRLTTHVKGNPPGPLVVIHLLSLTTADRLAAACIVVGALCAPLAYVLGRILGEAGAGSEAGERRGRVAAALVTFSPTVVLFGVTSVDYVFAALAAGIAVLMVARPRAARVAGCVLAGVASFFSWALLAIPVWAVLCVACREGVRRAAWLARGAVVAVVAVTLVLAAVWGYDPIAILRILPRVYAHGVAATRPYAFWVFGSPAAFLTMLGLPIVWLAVRALGRAEPAALALAVVIVVSAIAGFTKAETERIWLPYAPLACVAAASLPVPVRRLRLILVVLAVQAIAVEVLFGTVW